MTMTETSVKPIFAPRADCRACHGRLEPVLDLGLQSLPRFVKDPSETLPKAPLELVRCTGCGLLQLAHTTDPDLLYREFWYRSSINLTMRNALSDVVDSAMGYHRSGTWLDIGANDGFLLDQVPKQFHTIACEPAKNFADTLIEKADVVISDYFSADLVGETCDVITSVAMFYDLDDPNPFVADISKLLSIGGVWINQLNDAPTMLKQNAFDSICHEHLCYYDVHTLNKVYGAHGLEICRVSFNDINGGSVRIHARKKGRSGFRADLIGIPDTNAREVTDFAARTLRWRDRMRSLMPSLTAKGPLYGYGASTKGSTLLQYLDCNASILAIADRNPDKWGLHLNGIPIVDEAKLRQENPEYALVLPWAFEREFIQREAELRASGTALLFPLPDIRVVL